MNKATAGGNKAAATTTTTAKAPGSPISLAIGATSGAPHQVTVTTASQKTAQAAGIHGVLFSLAPHSAGSGPMRVSVDPSTFAAAFGGDYATRLHLVSLPACALTTPEAAACQTQTPLAPVGGSPLTAQVSLQASQNTVLAATSGTGGSAGTYSATSLNPAGTWSSGGSTGSFDYSYPIAVPPAIAGPTPQLALSYDSSTQDGRTEGTNNQSSWVGDGWDTSENFIERSYQSCSDDANSGAPKYSGDECWDGQVLTLSLNGQSTQIAYDDSTHQFHAVSDAANEKIEQVTGGNNGTYNGEYWRITENGTQYYFGLNRLPGYASGDATTQSAWTVPVYCANTATPCSSGDSTAFAGSSELEGWRWNLDYVVDLHGNATAFYYQPETNYYGADMKTSPVAYTRGGYLKRIDYGMTASTVYSGTAPEQVVFATAERCVPGTPADNTCSDSQFTVADAAYWPDVPIDQNCASTGSCANHGPSFWTRKELTSITTQIQAGGATRQVDEYDLVHSFPDGGDHAPTLWLDSIRHQGEDTLGGATASAPTDPISFDPPEQLPNRVGTIAGLPLMYHDRIHNITTETGAQITVDYNPATCTTANVPSDPAANTMPCFPVYWTPDGASAPELDWFQKYTVHSVLTQDLHDQNPDGSYPELLTTYKYDGGVAWHYDDNQVVKAKNRTYGQYRGYATVETRTGDPAVFHKTNGVNVFDQRTLAVDTYFRGMSQDTPTGTGGTNVTLTSVDGKYTANDADALAGQLFEADTYTADTAAGGTIDSATVTVPTVIGPTASQSRTGLPALTAQIVQPAKVFTRTAITGGWRNTETDSFYNTTLGKPTTGMVTQVDARGDLTDSAQARCTWTRYVDNPAESLVLPAETITSAQDCTTAGASQTGQLVSDTRTLYDGHAFTYDGASPAGTAPTKGEVSSGQVASGPTGVVTAAAFTTASATTYDSYGRVLTATRTPDSTAPDGSSLAQTTTNTYTPSSGALPTQETTQDQVTSGASPTYQTSTTTYDPARGLPIKKIDVAGLETDETYDGLGRLTAVWEPNRSKAAGATPNLTYSYVLSAKGPSVITESSLLDDGSYSTSETLFDALLRKRQTQLTSENSTTSVSDVQYDSHGWSVLADNSYNVGGAPAATLVTPSPDTIPDTTVTDYDGMGRPDLVSDEHDGVRTSTSTTAYAGDRTTVIPPTGGVAQTTYTDALGRTTELDQYSTAPTLTGSAAGGFTATGGTPVRTTYGYSPAGKQTAVTGPDGAVWTSVYDLSGNQTRRTDPDTGTSTFGYDDAGNQVWTKDSRGVELDDTYDLLDRKLTETNKATGFLEASWLYDTIQAGKPTSSTRYVPGVSGGYTIATTGYTSLGKSTGTKVTLPAAEAPLPTTYTTTTGYSAVDQLPISKSDPRIAGLTAEKIGYEYDALGNPTQTKSTLWTYVGGTDYTDYGQIGRLQLGPSTNPAYRTYSYDDQTKRLTDVMTDRSQAPGPLVDDTSYTYDASGNPLSATDEQEESGNTTTDKQCFQYDGLDRLREAWTAAGACPAQGQDPTSASIATGSGAYWQSYGYAPNGDRSSETDHAVNGQSGDTTTTYTNGGPTTCSATANQPHTLSQTSTTGPAGTSTTSFCSDVAGRLTSRSASSGSGSGQTLAWNDEGGLDSVTQDGKTTSFVYDAGGNELIRRDPGQTTLFLDDTEIVVDTSVTPHTLAGAVRSYTAGPSGAQVAVRSTLPGGGVAYTFGDPHGSTTMTMDVNTQAVSRQELTPYGTTRSSSGAWVDPTRGFLNKPVDAATGYTDVGDRKYDPALGRFLSSDPLFEATDPSQLGGYTYAGDNPILHDDPTGRSWWSAVTHVVNTVANVAHVVAPVLNVVAAATAAVPGLDVVTASAAAAADTIDTVASIAQSTVNVVNDIKDGKGIGDIASDALEGVVAGVGGKLAEGAGGEVGQAERDAEGAAKDAGQGPWTPRPVGDPADAGNVAPPEIEAGSGPGRTPVHEPGEDAGETSEPAERLENGEMLGMANHTLWEAEEHDGDLQEQADRAAHEGHSIETVGTASVPTGLEVFDAAATTPSVFASSVGFYLAVRWISKKIFGPTRSAAGYEPPSSGEGSWSGSGSGSGSAGSSSGGGSSSGSSFDTNSGGDEIGHGRGGRYLLD